MERSYHSAEEYLNFTKKYRTFIIILCCAYFSFGGKNRLLNLYGTHRGNPFCLMDHEVLIFGD